MFLWHVVAIFIHFYDLWKVFSRIFVVETCFQVFLACGLHTKLADLRRSSAWIFQLKANWWSCPRSTGLAIFGGPNQADPHWLALIRWPCWSKTSADAQNIGFSAGKEVTVMAFNQLSPDPKQHQMPCLTWWSKRTSNAIFNGRNDFVFCQRPSLPGGGFEMASKRTTVSAEGPTLGREECWPCANCREPSATLDPMSCHMLRSKKTRQKWRMFCLEELGTACFFAKTGWTKIMFQMFPQKCFSPKSFFSHMVHTFWFQKTCCDWLQALQPCPPKPSLSSPSSAGWLRDAHGGPPQKTAAVFLDPSLRWKAVNSHNLDPTFGSDVDFSWFFPSLIHFLGCGGPPLFGIWMTETSGDSALERPERSAGARDRSPVRGSVCFVPKKNLGWPFHVEEIYL